VIRAVVLGGSKFVWSELAEAQKLCTFDLVIAVNHAGRDFPGHVDHFCSLHANLVPNWLEQRRLKGLPPPGAVWTANHKGQRLGRRIDLPFRTVDGIGGSSGLLAARVALEVADLAVLCGIPMDAGGEHYDKPGAWVEAERYRKVWRAHMGELRGRVKSMGGWTASELGWPTKEWINGQHTEMRPRANRDALPAEAC
jgi:hypothetical protein